MSLDPGARLLSANPPAQSETEKREQQIRELHDSVLGDLMEMRGKRDDLNARIKVLVGEEDRLARMVRILDRAQRAR